jgi:hypothetical protein
MTLYPFVLNRTFTVRMWVRVGGAGTLFSVNRDSYRYESDEELIKLNV